MRRGRRHAAWFAVGAILAGCSGAGPSGSPGGEPSSSARSTPVPTAGATATAGPEALPPGAIVFNVEFGPDGADYTNMALVRTDGSGFRWLTEGTTGLRGGAAWLPGGTGVLFTVQAATAGHVFKLDLASGTTVQLTEGADFDAYPDASPDGSLIAFDRYGDTGPSAIFLANADGTGVQQLTEPSGDGEGDSAPVFSPDGRQLAYVHSEHGDVGAVWLVDVDGSHAHAITDSLYASRPRWSPDGSTIAYSVDNGAQPPSFKLVDVDGTNPRSVATCPGFARDASFSPDGKWLVFQQYCNGDTYVSIAAARVDGSDLRVIWHPEPTKNIFPTEPVWETTP